jgi:hypothetical protein
MSNSITRGELVRELASQGGHLDVNDLDPDLLKKDLDGAQALDGIENAAPTTAFDIARRAPDGTTHPTLAGEICQQLKAEVEANRQAASIQGTVHLGMRQPSDFREALVSAPHFVPADRADRLTTGWWALPWIPRNENLERYYERIQKALSLRELATESAR